MRVIVVVLGLLVAGCGAGASPSSTAHGTLSVASTPSAVASASAAALDPSLVPPGRIAYMRVDPGEVERFFTVDSLGTNETALFETKHCACISWSPTGSQIWTVTEIGSVLRFTTMDPDGGNRVVHTPDIATLSLTPPFGSNDGRHLVFSGWDDTDPTRRGIWAADADLTDLHQVTTAPDGVVGIDPVGMSADGSQIYFFGDLGESNENEFHHAGNVYVIAADGTGLRQLNPKGTKSEITGIGVSAEGDRLAFTAWQAGSAAEGNALFVVEGTNADAEQVSDWMVGLWGAMWAPTGEWIALTQDNGAALVASLIKPDGTGLRAISPDRASGPAFGPVWAADGEHFLVRRGEFHKNELWIMDLEGRFVWQVTHMPGSHDVYAWAPR